MKALRLTLNEWQKINIEIAKHYPRSVWMVRTKMRKVLGFMPREHREWNEERGYRTMMHLDFYDENQRTMFLLKYGDFIGKEDDNRL